MSPRRYEWACCNNNNCSGERIVCTKCRSSFHSICLQSLPDRSSFTKNTANWICPLCCKASKGLRNDNTPVRDALSPNQSSNVSYRTKKRVALSSPPEIPETPVLQNEIREIIREEIKAFMVDMKQTMSKLLSDELKVVKEELLEVKGSMNFINGQYEDIKQKVLEKTDIINELVKENSHLQNTLSDVSKRFNYLEQKIQWHEETCICNGTPFPTQQKIPCSCSGKVKRLFVCLGA